MTKPKTDAIETNLEEDQAKTSETPKKKRTRNRKPNGHLNLDTMTMKQIQDAYDTAKYQVKQIEELFRSLMQDMRVGPVSRPEPIFTRNPDFDPVDDSSMFINANQLQAPVLDAVAKQRLNTEESIRFDGPAVQPILSEFYEPAKETAGETADRYFEGQKAPFI